MMYLSKREIDQVKAWIKKGVQQHGGVRALARIMGVHDNTIRNWRNGKNEPVSKHYLWLQKRFSKSRSKDDCADF